MILLLPPPPCAPLTALPSSRHPEGGGVGGGGIDFDGGSPRPAVLHDSVAGTEVSTASGVCRVSTSTEARRFIEATNCSGQPHSNSRRRKHHSSRFCLLVSPASQSRAGAGVWTLEQRRGQSQTLLGKIHDSVWGGNPPEACSNGDGVGASRLARVCPAFPNRSHHEEP